MTSEAVALEDERGESVHSLAARFVAGDETALEHVYDRWSALVHTFALRAVRDPHDAEDITQQVFVAAWRGRHTLTPSPVALPAWLIGIARHKIADVRAARGRDADRIAAVVATSGPAPAGVRGSRPGHRRPARGPAGRRRRCPTRAAPSCSSPSGRTSPTPRSPPHRAAARHRQEPRPPWSHRAPPAAGGGAPWHTLTSTSCPRSPSTPPTGATTVHQHVASCASCTDLLDSLIAVRGLAGAEPLVDRTGRPARNACCRRRCPTRSRTDRRLVSVPAAAPRRRGIPVWAAGLAAARGAGRRRRRRAPHRRRPRTAGRARPRHRRRGRPISPRSTATPRAGSRAPYAPTTC